jgi:hypothetical protein
MEKVATNLPTNADKKPRRIPYLYVTMMTKRKMLNLLKALILRGFNDFVYN